MKWLLASAAAVAMALSACTTVLGPENTVRSSYPSPHSSEKTYRNILAVMRDCYPMGVAIGASYFPEAKEGELRLSARADTYSFDWLIADVKPLGSGSRVDLRRHSRFEKFDAVMPKWIEGDLTECPYGTRPDPRPPGSETNQNNMPVR